MTDIDLDDSNETPVRRKWFQNYGHVKAIVISCLNLPAAVNDVKKGGIVKVVTKRARDDDDESDDVVEVLGVRKAAIKK